MPGIFLRFARPSMGLPPTDSQLHLPHSSNVLAAKLIHETTTSQCHLITHSGYPIRTFDFDDIQLVVEGEVHSLRDGRSESELLPIALLLLGDSDGADGADAAIREWQSSHTGDFVLLARQKQTDRWALLSDPLGRLPIYYSDDEQGVTMGRDIWTVIHSRRPLALDRLALAQYLLFGFPLQYRSLYDGVKRLPPAALVRISSDRKCEIRSLSTLNVEDESTESYRAQLKRLEETFITSCESIGRMQQRVLLSLSGGLDSRTVAAGLNKAKVQFEAATFAAQDVLSFRDARWAKDVMACLGRPWQVMELHPEKDSARDEIVAAKAGVIYTSQAYDVEYFSRIRESYGDQVTLVSGDCGHRTLWYMLPDRKIADEAALIDYLISGQAHMAAETVTKLTGVSPEELRESVRTVVRSYPEHSMNYKYERFLLSERAMQWQFEGEDRNRYHFWVATPFYREPFFSTAIRCPQKYKRRLRIYRDLLASLSPALAKIKEANRGLAPDSWQFGAYLRAAEVFKRYPAIAARLRTWYRGTGGYVSADKQPALSLNKQDREWLSRHIRVEFLEQLVGLGAETGPAAREILTTLVWVARNIHHN